jgi:hypothetical protein
MDERSDAMVFFWLPTLPIGSGSVAPSMECHAAWRQDLGIACLVVFFDLLVVGQNKPEDIAGPITDTGADHLAFHR